MRIFIKIARFPNWLVVFVGVLLTLLFFPTRVDAGDWTGEYQDGGHWTGTITFAFDDSGEKGWSEAEKRLIREAVKEWSDLGIKIAEVSPGAGPNLNLSWSDMGNGEVTTFAETQVTFLNPHPTGIKFNTNIGGAGWYIDDDPATDEKIPKDQMDLLTTAKHEIGHCLGLDHADVSNISMNPIGIRGKRVRVTSGDATLLGDLYTITTPTRTSTVTLTPTETRRPTKTSSPTMTPTDVDTDVQQPEIPTQEFSTITPVPVPNETPTPRPTSPLLGAGFGPVFLQEEPHDTGVSIRELTADIEKKLDVAGHFEFIGMPNSLSLTVTTVNGISVTGPSPWVNVSGLLNPDGSFNATGTGTVAGRQDIGVQFIGNVTDGELTGDYSMGVGSVGRTLPTGNPIIFAVHGHQVGGGGGVSAATIAAFTTFTGKLAQALRVNDQVGLYQNLHPSVLEIYTAEQCQNYFKQRVADPTYDIKVRGVQGPATWEYKPEERGIQVPDVYGVDVDVTAQGQVTQITQHFGVVNQRVYWFTRCSSVP